MEEIKEASADTHLSIWVDCPYCGNYVDATEKLKEHLEDDLTADDLDVNVNCDNNECNKMFIVTDITY